MVILFFLLRKSVRKLFQPQKENGIEAKSTRAVERLHSIVFLGLGLLGSFIFYWIIYSSFYIIHNFTSTHGALVINHTSLMVPSLIFGFYFSTILSSGIYQYFVSESVSALRARISEAQCKRSRLYHNIFGFVVLTPAIILLAMQFNVYIKLDDGKLYQKDWAGEQKIYNLEEIRKISVDDAQYVNIHFENGAVVHTRGYSGNLNYFLDNISQ